LLITGGSSGIGLATAGRLAHRGASIALAARGEEALARASATLPGQPPYIAADLSDPAQAQRAADEAASRLGGLDAVVAAAAAAAYGPFVEMRVQDYRAVLESTLLSAVHVAHAALPHLARSAGTIVFVGSVAARVPVPWLAAYASAKHGVRGFSRSLACELDALGVPVRVALVNPGPVDTPFWRRVRTPDGRLPPKLVGAYRPEDVAAEVERALRGRRSHERTVGGLMAAWELIDGAAPNSALRAISPFVRLGWRNRERRPASEEDALAEPLSEAKRSGGLASRPSLLTKLRAR
jgi:NAD(P)-dependent dehydrogenase (short-subunit alcohol dehydrogenase family)